MKALVVGCGSIGYRRAEILLRMGHEVWVYDTGNFNAPPGTSVFGIGTSPHKLYAEADAVLICTPAFTHHEVLAQATKHKNVRGIFVEKPLATDRWALEKFEPLIALLSIDRAVTMTACNLRFDRRIPSVPDVRTAVAYMGQHEKHWSPNHRPLPLMLDSIHELDLVYHLVGPIKKIRGLSRESYAMALIEHANGATSRIFLDRLADPPERGLLFSKANGTRHWISLWPPDYSMYDREMKHFMECVETGAETCNPLRRALAVTRWALELQS
jgi:predicted dehydrogenase